MLRISRLINSYRLKEARDFSCVLCPLPWDIAEEIRQWNLKNIDKEDLAGGPIKMELGKTSLFSNEFDIVKFDVWSPGLHELNNLITDNFECTETHSGEYVPHVTSAHVRKGLGQKYVGRDDFEGRKMTLTAAVFSGNDYRETTLPFKS
jgi:hypothetical protein